MTYLSSCKDCYTLYVENKLLFEFRGRIVHRINIKILDQDRFFLYIGRDTVGENNQKGIIFYHGSRSLAYEMLIATDFIKTFSGPIIFTQASGDIIAPYIHEKFGDVSFGELYFEIRDNLPQFTIDLEYTKYLIDYIKKTVKDIYFIGHSNGGIFGLLVLLWLPRNSIKAIISHMGGIGWDSHYYLDFKDWDKIPKEELPNILIYTGSEDSYKEPSLQAKRIFEAYDFKVDLFIEPNTKHVYNKNVADRVILNWISSN